MYRVVFLPEAKKDTLILYKSEPQAYKKLEKLIQELGAHPETGTGHPKPRSKEFTELQNLQNLHNL
jgi:toxin YoeB